MTFKRIILSMVAPIGLTAGASPAAAQGMPVFDSTTYLQALQTARQTLTMVEQGRQQIQQAQETFNSLSKLTNVNAVARELITSQVRNILPNTTIDAETLLRGDFSQLGALGGLASNIQARYGLSSSGSDADAAYGAALRNATGSAATQAALGENTLAVSQTRMQGLDQLREQLSTAKDPKDVLDLQARIAVEQAQLQNDMLKMQAIQMAQAGEAGLANSRVEAAAARNAAAFYDANTIRR